MLAIASIFLTESLQQGTESYPTCCSGYLWITSPGTSRAISEASQELTFFWIDDVWVSGYIAQHLKIEHQVLIDVIHWQVSGKVSKKHKELIEFYIWGPHPYMVYKIY